MSLTYKLFQNGDMEVDCSVSMAAGIPEVLIGVERAQGDNNAISANKSKIVTMMEFIPPYFNYKATAVIQVPINRDVTCKVTDWFGSYVKQTAISPKGMFD